MLGTKVWGGTAASINGWHRPADDRTQQIHGWHKQMNPATQCNVNHHKQQQTSNSLWNWLDQVNLRQLLIEYDIFCQKPLLALKISLRNFFTTLLEGTRLLDFWVHYPTLPYSKLKNHYSQGPGWKAVDMSCHFQLLLRPMPLLVVVFQFRVGRVG